MSLMGMNRAFQKFGPVLGGIAAFLMLVTAFAGFGGNLFSRGGERNTTAQSAADKVVATVGDLKVTKPMLDNIVQRQIQQQSMFQQTPPPRPEEMDFYRVQALDAFKREQATVAAAKAVGVTITDADVNAERDKVWQSQKSDIAQSLSLPTTASDSQIDSALAAQNTSIANIKAGFPDYALRGQIAQEGLQKALRAQVQIDPDLVKRSYDDIQVRHILIKTGPGGLPDDQAKAKAQKILDAVKADPSKMAALANENSDDPGNTDPKTKQKKGGFYDWAPASQYVPEFSEAALKAGVGKVYPEIVKTQFGYHIIKLENERPGKDLPKDFDKNKQKYIDEYRDKIVQTKMSAAIEAAMPSITVAVTDPELHAIQLAMEAGTARQTDKKAGDAKFAQALDELNKVPKADDPLGVVPLQKARILAQLGRDKEAIDAFNEALKFRNMPELRLSLAQLYLKQKDNANAKLQLAEAQKLPIPDPNMEMGIAALLKQAGDEDGAKKAQAKAIELYKRQAELQKAQESPLGAAPLPGQAPPGHAPTSSNPTPPAPGKPKTSG